MLYLSRITNVGEALRDAIITYKSNVALIEANRHRENRRWTYREFEQDAEGFAGKLQARGFAAGDRCAILMQNQARWLISATGAFWAGAVVVPLDYKLTPAEQLALLIHAAPRVLVTEASIWTKLRAVAEEQGQSRCFERMVVFVTEPEGAPLGGALDWDHADGGPFQSRERQRDDVACIVYSSGTGGRPKGCMLTHGNYLAQAEILGGLYPAYEDDRYFSILPTNHAIDFMIGYILPLLFGAAVVHQRTLRPQFLAPTMKQYGVTQMAVVPTILKALERRIRDRIDDLPTWQRRAIEALVAVNEAATRRTPNHRLSKTLLKPIHDQFGGRLRTIFAGGAFVERSTAEFFYSIGIPVVIGYGLTEASTVVSVNDLQPFRPETIGKPVPGVEVEIRDANEAGIGELWVRGPTIMRGYVDEPELTAEVLVDGWLRTGDLGYEDASGHLRLVGRSKNMIVTAGGKNVYPEDIEAAFESLPGVAEFCVFSANFLWPSAHPEHDELIIAVRPEDGGVEIGETTLAELRERNHKLSDYKRLSGYVCHVQEFPRTASMKIKRPLLADELRLRARGQALRNL